MDRETAVIVVTTKPAKTKYLEVSITDHHKCLCIARSPQQLTRSASCANDSLLIFDCASLNPAETHLTLCNLARQSAHFAAALVNYPQSTNFRALLQWPQIRGAFPAGMPLDLLLKGLGEVHRGELWLPRHLASDLLDHYRRPPQSTPEKEPLTPREMQVLKHLAEGLTNEEIASKTSISKHTVKSHLYNAFRKLDVNNRLQASNWVKSQIL